MNVGLHTNLRASDCLANAWCYSRFSQLGVNTLLGNCIYDCFFQCNSANQFCLQDYPAFKFYFMRYRTNWKPLYFSPEEIVNFKFVVRGRCFTQMTDDIIMILLVKASWGFTLKWTDCIAVNIRWGFGWKTLSASWIIVFWELLQPSFQYFWGLNTAWKEVYPLNEKQRALSLPPF